MKKVVIFTLILGTIFTIFASTSLGKTKSYYSGDALVFQNNLYIATANTGNLEVFRLNGKQLDRLVKIRPVDPTFGKYGSFYDAHFRQEGNHLYVYAVSDFSLYKYEVVNNQLNLIVTQKNSYWEWYNRVDEIGGRLATISAKSVKIWSDDLQVIDEYKFSNDEVPYNVRGNRNFLLNVQDGKLLVYDRASRSLLREIPLNFKINRSAHQVYLDENNNLYVVDDYYAKKFNLNGQLIGSFKHLDYEGYDTAASGFSSAIYFSNGIGVVKLNQETMKAEDWAWTNRVAGEQGWAMGLKALNLNGDKIVVFNNSNILVLDEKLNKVASAAAEDEDNSVYATENLFLNLDKNRAAPGGQVSVNGGGFFPYEELSLELAGSKQTIKTDNRGRFRQILNVPTATAGNYDIKATAAVSKLTYSISFTIE